MRAIIVDDEDFSADYLESVCMEVQDLEIIEKFQFVSEALEFLMQNQIELVFMDIEMPGMSGLDATKEIHKKNPDIGVIFVTGYEQYAMEAFREDAVSYLLKPCEAFEVEKAVRKAEKLHPPKQENKQARIQTFGHFGVFIKEEPLYFANAKAKELLALLIDHRGSVVTMEQAVDVLWEDRPYDGTVKQLYRKAVIHLNQISKEKNIDFFVSNRGSCFIVPSKLDCDYYKLLEGDKAAERLYNGEYMLDYSWAEDTTAKIEHFLERI